MPFYFYNYGIWYFLLIILIMVWWYYFWHIKYLKVSIYFILSSEINAYFQWIKVIFSQVKWSCISSQVSDTIYVFTVAKIWKFLTQMHFKRFGKWEARWKWCYGHWRILMLLPRHWIMQSGCEMTGIKFSFEAILIFQYIWWNMFWYSPKK